ncbi:NADPH-dependent FMN reductase [Pseudomonas sp. VD9]|uniref:NADPH-dependent FMN reductase n=1 Tax=Pseudomonas sp. VD9 TaxID=3342076 RepID=UPI003C6C80F4
MRFGSCETSPLDEPRTVLKWCVCLLSREVCVRPPPTQFCYKQRSVYAPKGYRSHSTTVSVNCLTSTRICSRIPETIIELRSIIGQADGLLFSCPEYARGIPGAFKNMLDWLVSSEEFPGKPVALFNASPRASHAQAALRLVLDTMSARVIEEASMSVNLLSSELSPEGITTDPVIGPLIVTALDAFKRHLDNQNP